MLTRAENLWNTLKGAPKVEVEVLKLRPVSPVRTAVVAKGASTTGVEGKGGKSSKSGHSGKGGKGGKRGHAEEPPAKKLKGGCFVCGGEHFARDCPKKHATGA